MTSEAARRRLEQVRALVAGWSLAQEGGESVQIEALLAPLFAEGWLPDGHESVDAVLLGEQYHLGGEDDTRRMAELLQLSPDDRVVDFACYLGGRARQLAREYGCEVVGVDVSSVHIAVAERLTELTGLSGQVSFVCASADHVPLARDSFTVAWSQCSLPGDLSWLLEMDRVLAPGGRLGFTGLIRREKTVQEGLLSLEEMAHRVEALGYEIIHAEDISTFDLRHGWMPMLERLWRSENEYVKLLGHEWVRSARHNIEADIADWTAGRMGNGRVVGVKKGA
ncbi:MAG: methyltransferase domain-containing protein [Armatimonadetes bacterium]|nr:methyltransferase domain-containing protein [Armatimonadota bacterium]